MILSIYDIQPKLDEKKIILKDYDSMREVLDGEPFPSEIYQKVFYGNVEGLDDLEDVYMLFNSSHPPENFCGHSLSVSDVVIVHSGGIEEPGSYYCDAWGFKNLSDFDPTLAKDDNRTIRVVRLRSGECAQTVDITASTESYQAEVGGYFDVVYPFTDQDACLVVNDEGKILGMPLNRAISDPETGAVIDIIAGNCFICNCSHEYFDSLTDEQVDVFMEEFKNPEHFILFDGTIRSLPYDPIPKKQADLFTER